jgi:hypothetical protein
MGIQVIETTNDVIEAAINALDTLMDYIANSGKVMDAATHERYVSANIQDEEARQIILNTLHINGGLEAFLATEHNFLSSKQLAYSESLRAAKQRTEESWKDAHNILLEHYKGELETLIGYWKRRLKEEREAYKGQAYFSGVTFELCQRYPEIAKQLGIDCPNEAWPVIILIAVFCAVMCEGD